MASDVTTGIPAASSLQRELMLNTCSRGNRGALCRIYEIQFGNRPMNLQLDKVDINYHVLCFLSVWEMTPVR